MKTCDRMAAGGRIRFGGRRFTLQPFDTATRRFLREVAEAWTASRVSTSQLRLLSFRNEFREIQRKRPIPGLVWRATHVGSPEEVRCAVWLLGLCESIQSMPVILALSDHPDAAVRAEVARSLRRLRAWVELETMAQNDPDLRVRQIASSRPPGSYRDRLSRYMEGNVKRFREVKSPRPRPAMPFWTILSSYTPRPPKPRAVIRRLLEHIRHLVRGNGDSPAH